MRPQAGPRAEFHENSSNETKFLKCVISVDHSVTAWQSGGKYWRLVSCYKSNIISYLSVWFTVFVLYPTSLNSLNSLDHNNQHLHFNWYWYHSTPLHWTELNWTDQHNLENFIPELNWLSDSPPLSSSSPLSEMTGITVRQLTGWLVLHLSPSSQLIE